jgi:hypothetical protein
MQLNFRPIHVFIALFFFVLFFYFRADWNINEFTHTHYYFNYEHGFLKRGLIGEFFRQIGLLPVASVANSFALGLTLFIFVGFTYFFFRLADHSAALLPTLVVALALTTHSSTFQHYLKDLGRFDFFGVLILFLSVLIIEYKRFPIAFKSFLIASLLSLGILIHEACFLMYAPLTLAYFWYRNRGRFFAAIPTIIFGFLLLLTLYVSEIGTLTKEAAEIYSAELVTKEGYLYPPAIDVLTADMKANIILTFAHLLKSPYVWLRHILLFIIMIPTYKVLRNLVQSAWLKNENKILLLSSLSPLALHAIGIDHIRWSAIAIGNFFLAISLIAYNNSELRALVADAYTENKKMMLAVLFINLVIGPLAVMAIGW